MSLYEKHKEIVDLMMRETFNHKITGELFLDESGVIRRLEGSSKALASLYFTGNDVLNEENVFIYKIENDTDFKIFKPIIFTELYTKSSSKTNRKFFKHINYEIEIKNAENIELICKKLFNKRFTGNFVNKIYTKELNIDNVTNYYDNSIAILESETNKNFVSSLKHSFTDDIFKDTTFTIGLKNLLNKVSKLEFDIKDITADNIDEIGQQVQAVLY